MSMRHPMKNRFAPVALTPIAAALALTLAACGGGGGSAAGAGTSVKLAGTAIDAPISSATITITSGAPASAGGTPLGTVTTTAGDGSFTLNGIVLPAGSVPIFANATAPNNTVVLNSYLGQSDALAAAASLTTPITPSNLPDLDVSPVTTAALAVYGQVNNGSYASLTPATYATNLSAYRSEILAIAAGIKAVGDNLCTPTLPSGAGNTTTSLAAYLAANSNLTSGTSMTLSTVANTLGGSCAAALAALPGEIAADPDFGPELDLGDVIDANVAPVVTAGTYQLEGVIAEIRALAATSTAGSTSVPATVNPAAVFTDAAITVDAAGNITSSDGSVGGTVTGNLVSMTVKTVMAGTQEQYNLRLKLGVLPATVLTGGPAYVVEGGGTNITTGVLTNFEAVLAATTTSGGTTSVALPNWTGFGSTPSESLDGVSCPAGNFAIRLNASFFGSSVTGGSFGECVAPASGGAVWTMTPPSSNTGEDFELDASGMMSLRSTSPFTAANWGEYTTATTPAVSLPFVLTTGTNGASYTPPGTTAIPGIAYYVMGAHTIVFSSASGNGLLSLRGNSFRLNNLVAETQQESVDGGSGSVAVFHGGDH